MPEAAIANSSSSVTLEPMTEHDLLEVAPIILGVAAPAQALPAGPLEPQRRGVEEGNRDLAEPRQGGRRGGEDSPRCEHHHAKSGDATGK